MICESENIDVPEVAKSPNAFKCGYLEVTIEHLVQHIESDSLEKAREYVEDLKERGILVESQDTPF